MGLTKPAGSEARSVPPLNTNSDLLDKFAPCILVNDGVTPPTGDLYDGALVKERTSGIIWEARKNGGGTFDKVYVRYPYTMVVGGGASIPNSAVTSIPLNGGILTGSCKNATSAEINGSNEFVIPVKGIWDIDIHYSWAANGAGVRTNQYFLDGTGLTGDLEEVSAGVVSAATNCKIILVIKRLLLVGQRITPGGFQTSGGALNINAFVSATLVEPCQ